MQKFLIRRDPRLHVHMLTPFLRGGPAPMPGNPERCHTFPSGRYALFQGLKALGIGPGDHVVVPAYHCSAAVAPITAIGATPCFYEMSDDLSLNVEAIEASIGPRTKAVMGIHYFGYPQPLKRLKALCEAYGVFLIENCAHVLRGEVEGAELGTIGDISVFSWRKYLPLQDGGTLVLNRPGLSLNLRRGQPSLVDKVKTGKHVVERLLVDSLGLGLMPYRRLVPLSPEPAPPTLTDVERVGHSGEFNARLADREMSVISRFVLQHLDLQEIVSLRRRNAKILAEALGGIPGVRLPVPELPQTICPLAFPVLVSHSPRFHVRLRARGIPAFAWEGVVSREIRLADFPRAEYLFEHLFYLPLHQSLSLDDLELIVDVFKKTLSGCEKAVVGCS